MPVTTSKAVGARLRTLEGLLGSRNRARLLTIFVTHLGLGEGKGFTGWT